MRTRPSLQYTPDTSDTSTSSRRSTELQLSCRKVDVNSHTIALIPNTSSPKSSGPTHFIETVYFIAGIMHLLVVMMACLLSYEYAHCDNILHLGIYNIVYIVYGMALFLVILFILLLIIRFCDGFRIELTDSTIGIIGCCIFTFWTTLFYVFRFVLHKLNIMDDIHYFNINSEQCRLLNKAGLLYTFPIIVLEILILCTDACTFSSTYILLLEVAITFTMIFYYPFCILIELLALNKMENMKLKYSIYYISIGVLLCNIESIGILLCILNQYYLHNYDFSLQEKSTFYDDFWEFIYIIPIPFLCVFVYCYCINWYILTDYPDFLNWAIFEHISFTNFNKNENEMLNRIYCISHVCCTHILPETARKSGYLSVAMKGQHTVKDKQCMTHQCEYLSLQNVATDKFEFIYCMIEEQNIYINKSIFPTRMVWLYAIIKLLLAFYPFLWFIAVYWERGPMRWFILILMCFYFISMILFLFFGYNIILKYKKYYYLFRIAMNQNCDRDDALLECKEIHKSLDYHGPILRVLLNNNVTLAIATTITRNIVECI